MSDTEWGPWLAHDGKGCPCSGKYCQALTSTGHRLEGVPQGGGGRSWYWTSLDESGWSTDGTRIFRPIVQYRLRKDKGQEKDTRTEKGMDILKKIVAKPQKELEKV